MRSSSSVFTLLLVALVFLACALSLSSSVVMAGSFTQKVCVDPSCSISCSQSTLEQDVCYTTNKGDTATGRCESSSKFLQTTYPFSNDCSGLSDSQRLVPGQCYPSGNQYISFGCDDSQQQPALLHSTTNKKPPLLSAQNKDRVRQFNVKK